MARPSLRISITAKDEKALRKLVSGGVQQVRVVLRALALLQLAKGLSAPRIARVVPLTPQAIRKVGHRYEQGGLERALFEKGETPGGGGVGRQSATTDHRHGLQRSSGRSCPMDGAIGGRGGREEKIGTKSGERDYPHLAPRPRPQAVAGKKCGAWPTSMRTISSKWRMFWRRMNEATIQNNP